MDTRTNYPSNLTDRQWKIVSLLLPPAKSRGRRPLDRRWVLDAILYVVRSGCQWRMLPGDFPPWTTVYGVYWRWRNSGIWEKIHDALREKVRKQVGKEPAPTAAIIDSQSVRTADGGNERGFDAGKGITGRKRHIAVDTLGMVLAVVVHAACWQDYDGACFVFMKMRDKFRQLEVVFADSAYAKNGLVGWVKSHFGWTLQTIKRPVECTGFVVLPKRWIVERTFAWLGRYRRNSKDYEHTIESSQCMIYLSMINLMSRRLARQIK